MKIGYLGGGAWGFCLANMLAANGHEVLLWPSAKSLIDVLKAGKEHPRLEGHKPHKNMQVVETLEEAITGVDIVVESVTSQGIRPVLTNALKTGLLKAPVVLTSKGIEQDTGLLLSEVALEVLGPEYKEKIGCISGPSIAKEVVEKLPTSVVCSAYSQELMSTIQTMFTTPFFRVYPNSDMKGISFGGAMKNIIAIACGISSGLGFGENAKAALLTRGLHEIRKLGAVKGCHADTLNGLSGLGDLCVTCSSPFSRNHIFGKLLAQGKSAEEAKQEIGMVVEGAYSCVSALQLSEKSGIDVPITEAVHGIIYKGINPRDAVISLLNRHVKKEHL